MDGEFSENEKRKRYRGQFAIRSKAFNELLVKREKLNKAKTESTSFDQNLEKKLDYILYQIHNLENDERLSSNSVKLRNFDDIWSHLRYEEHTSHPKHKEFSKSIPEESLMIKQIRENENTITIEINLSRHENEIKHDIKLLLEILNEEAKAYNINFGRVKKRPTKGSKSIYEKYDLLIEVWDKIEKEKKTPQQIARDKFPEIFKYDLTEIARIMEGKSVSKLPWDGDEDEPMPIDQESAIKQINRYYKEAKRMIDGGWRQI
jgi:hypothetical protein